MNRIDEVNAKHETLRQIMAARDADSILLRRPRNIAWFTGGSDPSIDVSNEAGSYGILVLPEGRLVVANNIEEPRLHAEEAFEALGFEFHSTPWYAEEPPTTPRMATDEGDIEADIQKQRWVLMEPEQERLRALGRDAAAAIEEAARAVQPGDTEFEIASRLDAACRRRGGVALVTLIGTDERISQFRHPFATGKRLERYAMLVTCMRRHGLVVSATRLVHIGPAPDELHAALQRIASIDAAVMLATQPGRTLGDAFDDLIAAYTAHREAGQWTLHHQGGLAGYAARERIAVPGDPTIIQVGQAFAWNPSIVGCKSEDTMLLVPGGFEIVTEASEMFPTVEVAVGTRVIRRPGILEL